MDSVALLVCPRGSSSSAGSQEKGNFHYFLAVLSLLKFLDRAITLQAGGKEHCLIQSLLCLQATTEGLHTCISVHTKPVVPNTPLAHERRYCLKRCAQRCYTRGFLHILHIHPGIPALSQSSAGAPRCFPEGFSRQERGWAARGSGRWQQPLAAGSSILRSGGSAPPKGHAPCLPSISWTFLLTMLASFFPSLSPPHQ